MPYCTYFIRNRTIRHVSCMLRLIKCNIKSGIENYSTSLGYQSFKKELQSPVTISKRISSLIVVVLSKLKMRPQSLEELGREV